MPWYIYHTILGQKPTSPSCDDLPTYSAAVDCEILSNKLESIVNTPPLPRVPDYSDSAQEEAQRLGNFLFYCVAFVEYSTITARAAWP